MVKMEQSAIQSGLLRTADAYPPAAGRATPAHDGRSQKSNLLAVAIIDPYVENENLQKIPRVRYLAEERGWGAESPLSASLFSIG
jgi:hypothetical protein